MLVVGMISVDAYPLIQTWPLTLKIQKQVFSGYSVPPDSKETELRSSDQEASPSAGKNTGIVLVPCHGYIIRVSMVIVAKWFWKLSNFHLLLKQKSPSLTRNLAVSTFSELLIGFSGKVNLPYLHYSAGQRCCLLHLIKQNCLLKTFLRTLIVITQVSLFLFSLLEVI